MASIPITEDKPPTPTEGTNLDMYDVAKWPVAGDYSRRIRLALAAARYDVAYGLIGEAAAELERIAQGDRLLSQSTPWVRLIRQGDTMATDTRVVSDLNAFLDVTVLGDLLDVTSPVDRKDTMFSYLGSTQLLRLLKMVIGALPMGREDD